MLKKNRLSMESEVFLLLLVNFIFLWLYFNLSQYHLDSPGDMVENYAWGIAWDWGNNKHPPLFSWITASWFYFFPTKNWSYFLLSSCNLLATSFFLILSMRHVLEKKKVFIALALTIIILPLSVNHGYKYNANLAQLPFLTAYMWALIRAVKNHNKSNYVIAGLFAGAGMLCKYSAVLLLGPITLAVWVSLKPELPRFALGLFIVTLVSSILFAPHVYWEVQHQWPSMNYLHSKHDITGWNWFRASYTQIPEILKFFLSSFIVLVVAIASTWPYFGLTEANGSSTGEPPIKRLRIGLITFVLSLLCIYAGAYYEEIKPDTSWFIVCTIFFGWAVVDLFPRNLNIKRLSIRVKQTTLAYLLIATICALYFRFLHYDDLVHVDALPEIFAHDVTEFYHNTYHEPIAYVGGTHPLAYDVTFYSSDHPTGVYGVDAKESPWVDLNKFKSKNKIIVCASEKKFFPKEPECSEEALKMLGQPTQKREFNYKAFDVDSSLSKFVKYDVFIYRK